MQKVVWNSHFAKKAPLVNGIPRNTEKLLHRNNKPIAPADSPEDLPESATANLFLHLVFVHGRDDVMAQRRFVTLSRVIGHMNFF
jgi:hypothetical protein